MRRWLRVVSRLLDVVFHSKTAAFDGNGLGMMEKSVEHGGGESGVVVKDRGPLFVDAIGGEDGRASLVALADDLEQEVGAGFVDGEVADFVENQNAWPGIFAQLELELPGGLSTGEGVDDIDGGCKEDGVPLLAGGETQGGGEMSFAKTNAADEHDIDEVVDKLQTEEILDLGTIDFLGPVPLELLECFAHGKAGESHASFDGAVLSSLGFAFDELGEEGDVVAVLFGGKLGEVVEVLVDEGEFEVVEIAVERFGLGGAVRFGCRHGGVSCLLQRRAGRSWS